MQIIFTPHAALPVFSSLFRGKRVLYDAQSNPIDTGEDKELTAFLLNHPTGLFRKRASAKKKSSAGKTVAPAPEAQISNKEVEAIADKFGIKHISVSITHTANFAIASVVALAQKSRDS